MTFDPKDYSRPVAGFEIPEVRDGRVVANKPRYAVIYAQGDEPPIQLAGSRLALMAYIDMDFEPSKVRGELPTKVIRTTVKFNILSDDTYEGHEHTPGASGRWTDFSYIDQEKKRHSAEVLRKLKERLNKGTINTSGVGNCLGITVETDRPYETIEQLQKAVDDICTADKRGEKPLGDIAVPQWRVRPNPDVADEQRFQRALENLPNTSDLDPTIMAEYKRKARARVKNIKENMEKYFPIGQFVAKNQHRLFRDEILKIFELSEERFAALPSQCSGDENLARHAIEQVLEHARKLFPVDGSVTKRAQIDFNRRIDTMFPNRRDAEPEV